MGVDVKVGVAVYVGVWVAVGVAEAAAPTLTVQSCIVAGISVEQSEVWPRLSAEMVNDDVPFWMA